MRAVDIIRKKRDGQALTPDEIAVMVEGIATREVADYQWSALLMAIVWRGMTAAETAALTDSMIRSGKIVDLAAIPGPQDRQAQHRWCGRQDVARPGADRGGRRRPRPHGVGRGLGHTGGTLDKLESIPGFRVDVDLRATRKCWPRADSS